MNFTPAAKPGLSLGSIRKPGASMRLQRITSKVLCHVSKRAYNINLSGELPLGDEANSFTIKRAQIQLPETPGELSWQCKNLQIATEACYAYHPLPSKDALLAYSANTDHPMMTHLLS